MRARRGRERARGPLLRARASSPRRSASGSTDNGTTCVDGPVADRARAAVGRRRRRSCVGPRIGITQRRRSALALLRGRQPARLAAAGRPASLRRGGRRGGALSTGRRRAAAGAAAAVRRRRRAPGAASRRRGGRRRWLLGLASAPGVSSLACRRRRSPCRRPVPASSPPCPVPSRVPPCTEPLRRRRVPSAGAGRSVGGCLARRAWPARSAARLLEDRARLDHEVVPDQRREGAARDRLAAELGRHRLGRVRVADPDGDVMLVGEADEPGVAVVLGRAGLARGERRRSRRACRCRC